ncbi:hypothetical protein BB561_006393 [Smittium simulii]|uniref:Anthranilate synthase component 2 n=1 Tax=Smittium simulii TaxID=133385 RepID=A0A2T9Y4X8_9FUNG|nr:hypothetical protein BB561_006393 [Smittium simulii]
MPVLLIDNYDSFTWNVYEGLCKAGADVQVHRNDKITMEDIRALNPSHIVISPGPGHPSEFNGVCNDVLKEYSGKTPILGVCLGMQIMYTYFGGDVKSAGEFVHGKTDLINHDSKGIYRNVPQDITATRYHSLTCTVDSLPECMEFNSYCPSGLAMGVRHKIYTVEGVQYHPDSFLSEQQITMLKNFLDLTGGTWALNPNSTIPTLPLSEIRAFIQSTPVTKSETILETIHKQRLLDIQESKALPGRSLADLETLLEMEGIAPPAISFYDRLSKVAVENPSYSAVIAEVKRASPSKGDIGLSVNAAKMGFDYAQSGASAISVLTEPKWFKGRLEDMLQVRQAVSQMRDNRPAILRKDFIVDKYQIAEARLYGADAVLLIVALLSLSQLTELLEYTHSLGMDALVEVNSQTEVQVALQANSRIIGVNNRNLHSFAVEMDTTTKLSQYIPKEIFYISLSGVINPSDAIRFKNANVNAFLVGEGLMKTTDKRQFIHDLTRVFD